MTEYNETCDTKAENTDFPYNNGNEQQTVKDICQNPVETPRSTAKRSKKPLIILIIGLIILSVSATLLVYFFTKDDAPETEENGGLIEIDRLEYELNDAYIYSFTPPDYDYEGVTDFTITDVNEKTHDQTFSCFVTPPEDVFGYQVSGLIKNGQVIELQTIFMYPGYTFSDLDRSTQMDLMALSLFPVSIFNEDVEKIEDFLNFLLDMRYYSGDPSDSKKRITTDGDIEYTHYGSVSDDLAISTFTIRYLPAFSCGYFEDESN